MKELFIDIDYPSCKSSGFSSDIFSTALKDKFRDSQYTLKILFTSSPVGNFFPSGYSRIELTNAEKNEVDEIRKRIDQVFRELSP